MDFDRQSGAGMKPGKHGRRQTARERRALRRLRIRWRRKHPHPARLEEHELYLLNPYLKPGVPKYPEPAVATIIEEG